ncbi:MAG: DUF551 domain-containing protein [Flavobacteriales bacterium]|jgi:hypothetical protein|nr:DUF551 domain-containing protein [Flavobacteriales bacterium]MBK6549551.1 DUF551 domain-containing protein [Flavobacteriales bacterium]MBK6883861.1 DUF551 domain-containing protein [Flavobacteriales bacterium]MBK7100253.1 DUF551 domain-containing protein [Flavobacteriales bacterium]MBK7110946.1 DUF551 domain-containing protein [Flavobacteriales bacterium]
MAWISTKERLPEDGTRVLCYLPRNVVFLPGKTGASELRDVVILRFAKDFFVKNPSKTGYSGSPHFWLGEGTSNRYFDDVVYWMALPEITELIH